MQDLLTAAQRSRYDEFKKFAAAKVEPFADVWDREQHLSESVIHELGDAGYLGATLPPQYGGSGWDVVTFGLLNEALGHASSAVAGVVTVQTMVSMTILKWGTSAQKNRWLPLLARGDAVGAFALTEPGAGSDLQALATRLTPVAPDVLLLTGHKTWISSAQFADVFLVFGKLADRPAACLLPRDTPGLTIEAITDLMGFRAAGLGQLHLKEVEVSAENLVGKAGFALSHLAPFGLHYGRISTACSALGLLRGCVSESAAYATSRRIGERRVGDAGMIRSLLARMGTDLEAASFLCFSACRAEDEHSPEAFERALMAKYFTSKAAVQAASDAVQIRGASGCHGSAAVSRFYRDAKIMEIIEGTTQVHEDLLGRLLVDRAAAAASLLPDEEVVG